MVFENNTVFKTAGQKLAIQYTVSYTVSDRRPYGRRSFLLISSKSQSDTKTLLQHSNFQFDCLS